MTKRLCKTNKWQLKKVYIEAVTDLALFPNFCMIKKH